MSREEVKEAATNVRDTQKNSPDDTGRKLLDAARDVEKIENGNDVQDLQDFSRELNDLGFPSLNIVDYNDGQHDGEPEGTLDIVDPTSGTGYYTAQVDNNHLTYTRNDDTKIDIDLATGAETTTQPNGAVTIRTEPGGEITSEQEAPSEVPDTKPAEKPDPEGTNGPDTGENDGPDTNNPTSAPGEPVEVEVPPEYRVIANEQQLEVRARAVDGKTQYEFFTNINDNEEVMLATDKPPQAVREELARSQDEKLKILEETYRVDIAQDGDVLDNNNQKIVMTTPTLGELSALEQGLVRSAANLDTRSGEPLKIYVGDKGQDIADVAGQAKTDGTILMAYNDDLSNLARVTIHEMAHVGQLEQFENFAVSDDYANRLGWTRIGDEFVIRDKDGGLWKRVPGNEDDANETNDADTWMRVNEEGYPADAEGNRADAWWNPFDTGEEDAQVISQDSMIDRMEVTPATNYIKEPIEMGADLVTEFRRSSDARGNVYRLSPSTYDLAKQMDQEQIDAQFGTDNGEPKLIRNPDGILVPNSPQSRQMIADWEATLK